jgi:hypothetical protein
MTFNEWSKQFDAIFTMFERQSLLHYSEMLLNHCKKYKSEWNFKE